MTVQMTPQEKLKYDYLVGRREIGAVEFDAILAGDGDLEIVIREADVLFIGPDWLFQPADRREALALAQSLMGAVSESLCDNCAAAAAAVN